jgi:hypothetical protein
MHGSGTTLGKCEAYIRSIYKVGTLVGFDIELPCVVVNTLVPFIFRHLHWTTALQVGIGFCRSES